MKILIKNGELPKKLAKVIPPTKCTGCIYGTMTKVLWCTKESDKCTVFVTTKAGECISIDRLILTQIGFVAQLKGTLPKRRYMAATVFVDNYLRLQYVHLMEESLTLEETIKAKRAFEHFSSKHGVRICQYHADNGRFADNAFVKACTAAGASLFME